MITIVGLGPGSIKYLLPEAIEALEQAEEIYVRTKMHPVLDELNFQYQSFDSYYDEADDFDSLYQRIADELIRLSENKNIVYAVPGSPFVAEKSVEELLKRTHANVITGVSFLEPLINALKLDPTMGLSIFDGLSEFRVDPTVSTILLQVYSKEIASDVKLRLMESVEPERMITIVKWAGIEGKESLQETPLYLLDRYDYDHLTSIFIPKGERARGDIEKLLWVTEVLRSPEGCPWDRAQTHESLKQFLLEEVYEVMEAINTEKYDELQDELGDLLFQVVFHSSLASELGYFDFSDVVESITDKLIRRHTHVFQKDSAESPDEVLEIWEKNKQKEKTLQERLQSIPEISSLHYAQKAFSLLRKNGVSIDVTDDNLQLESLLKLLDECDELGVSLDALLFEKVRNLVI